MTRKWKDSRGFSLVEMLCATVILVLLGLLINTGLNLAVKSYRNITAQEELELLVSNLSSVLADDLRYAKTPIKAASGDTLLEYHSERYNISGNTSTKLSIGKGYEVDGKEKGQLYANTYRVLPSGAYGSGGAYVINKNDGTSGLTITYDEDTRLFTVDLTVKQAEGELFAKAHFTVRRLSPDVKS